MGEETELDPSEAAQARSRRGHWPEERPGNRARPRKQNKQGGGGGCCTTEQEGIISVQTEDPLSEQMNFPQTKSLFSVQTNTSSHDLQKPN